MDGNFTIGRFGGVEVRLHWSLLAVFALIVWSLADGVFPSQNPGLSGETHLAMAIAAALLFLASILLHELGHSWVARREGIEVDSISLWLFGGVAQFKDRFPSAGAEFRVAVAGPLVSIGLGVVFVAIALPSVPSAVDGVAAWLGYINLVLAAFNLLPASPLDGGRVLHAAFWRAKGDDAWATRVASEIGQGFGYLFIALGLAMFVFQGAFSGAWLAFLGWYLLQGARAEARYVATEQALGGLHVRDLMARRPVTVDADSTIGRVMDDVAGSHRFTTYPVLDGAVRSASSPSPRSPRCLARSGIHDVCGTRCSRWTTCRSSPRTRRPSTPWRSSPGPLRIAGSWSTTGAWPAFCRSPTSRERSKSDGGRPGHRAIEADRPFGS
jgi:Zn-dependent protease